MAGFPHLVLEGLLELLHPECCCLCGARREEVPWCEPGPPLAGLRPWDAPHLCLGCRGQLERGGPLSGRLDDEVPVHGASATSGDLVRVIGAWKYHGLRGVAWPLAGIVARALDRAGLAPTVPSALVPIPLHTGRRRARGFNQAAMLAGLLARAWGTAVRDDILARRRPTRQQARIASAADRRRNVAGVFAARSAGNSGDAPVLWLVDDVVTTGATACAAAASLRAAGWPLGGVVCVGLSGALAG